MPLWRAPFEDGELGSLLGEAFGGAPAPGLAARIARHSLGWAAARDAPGRLVGFVNVAWDGGAHAFLLDTAVAGSHRHQGLGRALVALAAAGAREAGCDWLHVDYEERLRPFYENGCGFATTAAGLIRLSES
ncbi:GNAT family N-acetyltransferase [Streptomyces sp. SPB074]|uniref:GNAT family N-acetyltransferase n=1 Tax=Streptomyces sp. (strain SPB074) TaxID=465543 RepID=UPI000569E678|nr:GNAT family N-acetyltransferase [Streptomyces sp. SPB074]